MKLTILGRFLTTEYSVKLGHWNITASQRLGRKSRLLKCCGDVHQIEELYQDADGFGQWRGINDYICTKCHSRAKIGG